MKKKISFSTQGQRADIGDHKIYRMLPNRYADAVGPFVFLDHIPPRFHENGSSLMKAGTGAHPHRGIATLTYILNGEGTHFDSRGHHAKVYSGGAQWMKAGNGIIHDETFNPDSQTGEMLTHGFQFWINLPSKIKLEAPEYLSVMAGDVPKIILEDKIGWLKVLVGDYEGLKSMIPNYSKQFLFHLHLEAGKNFTLKGEQGLEYAAFLPQHNAIINENEVHSGDFVEFDREEGEIQIVNASTGVLDILLFGGENYSETIVAQGPFVMNSLSEIAEAYRDFYAGKYGEIKYSE